MIILHHGSNVPIEKIDLSKSKIAKDFGCGFYLSENENQALEMAKNTVSRMQFGTPIVTSFMFDDKLLIDGSLSVKIFEDYTPEWAQFIYDNRNNSSRIQIHNFDIVYGPIANDRVGVQLRRFMEGYIDIERLIEELKYKTKTFQYFMGSELAISKLKKI